MPSTTLSEHMECRVCGEDGSPMYREQPWLTWEVTILCILSWTDIDWAVLKLAGLDRAGLGWAGLGWAGLGRAGQGRAHIVYNRS